MHNWVNISDEKRDATSTLNHFFCGLHVIVGMAETALSTLKEWELMYITNEASNPTVVKRDTEAGTVRLVGTACKAFQKHGSEQSGAWGHFNSFLQSNGVQSLPLAKFKGKRLNILFYDAGALFSISPLIIKFLKDLWGTPNQLLRAVLVNIQVP